jgi:2-octaprenyl-6-methoxyphenol hydroxylase
MRDMLVVGAGYVGLSAAVAVKQAAPHLQVTVVEAAPEGAWQKDMRASAIIAAATKMLDVFGVWNEIEPTAQPINRMIVTDSKTSDPVRPVFLTFDGESDDGQPFAHMVPNVSLVRALRGACERLGIEIRHGLGATGLKTEDTHAEVTLSDGSTIDARLVVACDGVRSHVRDLAGIKTVSWDYGQSGIVVTVEHERPHNGCAEEHFLPAGPFAILPLKDNRSSLVWTETTGDANRLVRSDDLIFEEELERRFGHKLGALKVIGERARLPARPDAGARLRGAAAGAGRRRRPRHPPDLRPGPQPRLQGRGSALAETIVDADRLGLDIGSINILERYQAWRRFDTFRMGVTTDVLNRVFSNDIAPIRIARDFGLGIVDRLPGLKSFFIGQAAGTTAKDNPRLLAGQTI